METEKVDVYFTTGYGGACKGGAIIDGVDYHFEMEDLKRYLAKQIEEKGYTTSITKRQKYPRITINQ